MRASLQGLHNHQHDAHHLQHVRIDRLTTSSIDSRNIVIIDVIVDPGYVRILFRRVALLLLVQPFRSNMIAEQAWQERDLQREPVFRDADVEDVATVRGAGCVQVTSVRGTTKAYFMLRTLTLLVSLHVFLRQAEVLALFDV